VQRDVPVADDHAPRPGGAQRLQRRRDLGVGAEAQAREQRGLEVVHRARVRGKRLAQHLGAAGAQVGETPRVARLVEVRAVVRDLRPDPARGLVLADLDPTTRELLDQRRPGRRQLHERPQRIE
jgi:hypothetical protein